LESQYFFGHFFDEPYGMLASDSQSLRLGENVGMIPIFQLGRST